MLYMIDIYVGDGYKRRLLTSFVGYATNEREYSDKLFRDYKVYYPNENVRVESKAIKIKNCPDNVYRIIGGQIYAYKVPENV